MGSSTSGIVPDRYCVIGAGAAGLATCRALSQFGLPFDCFERERDIGGLFNYGQSSSSVYKSAHLLSSKSTSEFPDFPMPADYPPYPHHTLVLEYFQSYARHFGLYDQISFNISVESVEPTAAGWEVRFAGGRTRRYRGVIIANGHHSIPILPQFPGQFDGVTLHSKQYRTPEIFADKRVLVVGAGNSACDVALDAVPGASRVYLSIRRSCYFLSKFSFGKPGDVTLNKMGRLRFPMWLRRFLVGLSAFSTNGRPERLGLPTPDHKLLEAHSTVNSLVPYKILHGDIVVKPNIASLDGDCVHFADGSTEAIDVIVYATGFKVAIPFVRTELLNWKNEAPDFFMHVLHPERDDLAIMGLFQSATSGHWFLMHYQAQLLARFLAARDQGADVEWFRKLKALPSPDMRGGFGQVNSERHRLTVDPMLYERQLKQLIGRFDRLYDFSAPQILSPRNNVAQLTAVRRAA